MEPIRISPLDAKDELDRGQVIFLDTRSAGSWGESDLKLPGAIRVPPDEVAEHLSEIPRDRGLITYCT
jgi:rhodanese-related sulfurtransferase